MSTTDIIAQILDEKIAGGKHHGKHKGPLASNSLSQTGNGMAKLLKKANKHGVQFGWIKPEK